ncbi:hypothetical protein [Parapedobacter sp. 2B3]|uniref:hypothetical protein n=1 Tax=Parapedobacter sp. 2B3 TaxID=3342381 RepID=UPI0035B5F62C
MTKYGCLLAFLVGGFGAVAQPFAGVDDLGRVLPQYSETGGPKANRHVGLFYFLWQGHQSSATSERHWDLTKLQMETPEIFEDFDHPGWGGGAGRPGKYYFWGESIYGYYRGDDYWVHLKNIQLLTDAGVDFLVLDATNRITYTHETDVLMQAMETVRKQGKQPPKIVFYTNTKSGEGMQEIYENHYKEGAPYRYPDCWYYLEGKPLIIGLSKQAAGRDYERFFTIRESQWPNEPAKVDGWPWIEFQRPQKVYINHKGEREIVNVSAAQHPNLDASMGGSAFYGATGNWGRSFRNGSPGNPETDILHGYNIQEQWDFALKQNVPFVFITGWNEWIAGKWRRTSGNLNHAHFVDQANSEYSRDIEPSWTSNLRDLYYMQMVGNIRHYKGTEKVPVSKVVKRKIASWADWDKIDACYVDYVGDVTHRHHPGAQSEPKVIYDNQTGRNDLDTLKVAASPSSLHFYVSTVNDITPVSADDWMTLWLNTDQSYESGWNGFDFRVVGGNRLERYKDGSWQRIAEVDYRLAGNRLMVDVPLKPLGLPAVSDLEFKWSDNMQKADPIDWYINGDAAPGGRFTVWARF